MSVRGSLLKIKYSAAIREFLLKVICLFCLVEMLQTTFQSKRDSSYEQFPHTRIVFEPRGSHSQIKGTSD